MGTHCSSELNRGHIFKSKTTTMKLLLLTVFVAGAFATEEAAKAEEPAAPVAVAPVHHGLRPFYGLWGHQQGWHGVVAPGSSSQCFGCRGKRSAEADAEAGYYGYPYYGYGHYYGLGYGYGHALPGHSYTHVHRVLGKRSADAEADAEPGYYGYPYYGLHYGFGYGHALPGHSYAHVHRALGKRSAEPGYYHPYGFYGYPYHFGYHALKPLKPLKSGTAVHPGFATSFVETSGAAGK